MIVGVSDTWVVGFGIFQVVFSLAVTVAMFWLASVIRRYEGMENRVHELTTKLVDERFRGMTHEVRGHLTGLISTVDDLKERIRETEQGLDGVGDNGLQIELRYQSKLDVLKDYIRDNTASSGDVQRMGDVIAKLDRTVAVLVSKTNQAGGAV